MKKLLGILVLIFFTLQAPSWADDIRDFQIEGMSIGDSLLDYFSEEQIKNNEQIPYKSKKFIPLEFKEPKFSFNNYESIQTAYKSGDQKYIIYTISGSIFFPNNINACYKKQKEILRELNEIFGKLENVTKIPLATWKHSIDESGKSKVTDAGFDFKSKDAIVVQCMDFSNEADLKDELVVAIDTHEFIKFLNTEAY